MSQNGIDIDQSIDGGRLLVTEWRGRSVRIDWNAVSDEFHSTRETRLVQQAIKATRLDHPDLTLVIDSLAKPTVGASPTGPERHDVLERLWNDAMAESGLSFLFAYLLYAELQWAWELSADGDRIVQFIDDVIEVWDRLRTRDKRDTHESRLTEVMVRHIGDLRSCIGMENGLNCSCPIETGKHASNVVDSSRRLLAQVPVNREAATPESMLRGILRAHELYFEGVQRTSEIFLQSIKGTADSHLRALMTAEHLDELANMPELRKDVYSSELRSHAVALRALARRLDRTQLSVLQLPDLSVTYVLPFTTEGPSHAQVIAATRARKKDLCAGTGLAPTLVEEVDLSDVWTHGRRHVIGAASLPPAPYQAVSLVLPDMWIRDTTGRRIGPHRLELRFSSFGNHHLRISGAVNGADELGQQVAASFHDLNQAIRRGSGFMGSEQFTIDGIPEVYSTLTELSSYIIRRVATWAKWIGIETPAVHLDAALDAHVLITIGHAVVVSDGERGRTATGGEILDALGPLVQVPVERTAAGLEEWLRYDDPVNPHEVANFLGDFAPTDSLAVQTPRTTCLYAPGQPDWSLRGTSEMIEFVVSARALVRQWLRWVQHAVDEASTMLDQRLRGNSLEVTVIRDKRLELADTAATVRHKRSVLHSEELARSPGHRQILSRLLSTSGAGDLEADLDRKIEQLDALYERLGSDAHAIEAESQERYRTMVELILFVLAVLSLADLLTFGNDLLFAQVVPALWVRVELALLGAVLVGAAAASWVLYRRASR